jgi:hypothetical protein
VTATRDRDSDLDSATPEVEWDEHPVVGRGRGLPWWAAVLLAFALTVIGAVVDKDRLTDDHQLTSLGIYHVLFVLSCVVAVLAVRRRNLFGPMVQPPLIFALTIVPVQLMFRNSTETSTPKKLIFEVGVPLASNFPWMAGATVATILLGVIRLLTQRDPNRRLPEGEDKPRRDRDADRGRDRAQEDRPPRRPAREDRPRDERPREDQARRESAPRRPREDRDERPPRPAKDREDRRDRGGRPDTPPRRNPQRPREQGGRPPQRRRPREDDHRD